MKTQSQSPPALIVIDVQKGIDESEYWGGNGNNPEAEGNIKLLLTHWTEKKLPVFIIRHVSVSEFSPFFPGKPGTGLKDFITATEIGEVIEKSASNAFINTLLEDRLREKEINTVFITGFITNNSVEATARMSGELGFRTIVVSDATATFNKTGLDGSVYSSELIHQISLANLKDEYASIRTTLQVMEELASF